MGFAEACERMKVRAPIGSGFEDGKNTGGFCAAGGVSWEAKSSQTLSR